MSIASEIEGIANAFEVSARDIQRSVGALDHAIDQGNTEADVTISAVKVDFLTRVYDAAVSEIGRLDPILARQVIQFYSFIERSRHRETTAAVPLMRRRLRRWHGYNLKSAALAKILASALRAEDDSEVEKLAAGFQRVRNHPASSDIQNRQDGIGHCVFDGETA